MKRLSLTPFAFIIAALLIALLPAPALAYAPASQRTIRIAAGSYAFSPAVVRVNPGDQVTIELVAQDVVHGLSIDGYPLNLQADPGQTARATFTANRVGTFKLRCSIPCGNLHPFMTGKLQVGPNLLLLRAAGLALLGFAFSAWRIIK